MPISSYGTDYPGDVLAVFLFGAAVMVLCFVAQFFFDR